MRFAVVLLILGVGLGLLVLNHDSGQVFGLPNDEFAGLIFFGTILTTIGANAFLRYRGAMPQALKAVAAWLFIFLVLVAGYGYRDDVERIGRTTLAVLVPGTVVETDEPGTVLVARSSDGHFRLRAKVNGASARMIVDTGASSVVLTDSDARAAGIDVTRLVFDARVSTANGTTTAASVVVSELAVGGISERQVRALVARPGQLDTSLLGNTFLDRLASFTVAGNRLTMTR